MIFWSVLCFTSNKRWILVPIHTSIWRRNFCQCEIWCIVRILHDQPWWRHAVSECLVYYSLSVYETRKFALVLSFQQHWCASQSSAFFRVKISHSCMMIKLGYNKNLQGQPYHLPWPMFFVCGSYTFLFHHVFYAAPELQRILNMGTSLREASTKPWHA